jgi:hypothetical protein
MAIDESKSRLDSTSACYDASCQHAEKVQKALKRATINLNLRQGQANSPDHSDFATTVVHDPADHDFMGGELNPQERITTKPAPSSPPLAPLTPTSLPQKSSIAHLVLYGPQNLYPKRQCCEQSTQPWAPPPPSSSPPPSTASAYTDLHNKLLGFVNRPYPPFVTHKSRRMATKSLLEVCSLFQSVARADIGKWCSKQHHDSKCSLNTIFDLVCANPLAEVPDTYYTAISALDGSTFDLDIIPCDLLRLLSKQ